jgi:integrase
MLGALNKMAGLLTSGQHDAVSFDWAQLRYQHTVALRSVLMTLYAPKTANRMLCALRKTLRAAWELGQMETETFHRAANIADIKAEEFQSGRALTEAELGKLFAVCEAEATAAGDRDAGMLGILCAGLRRSEVVNLMREEVDLTTGSVKVLNGKGRKSRITYLPTYAIPPVQRWLDRRGDRPGPLFCPINRGDNLIYSPNPLQSQAVLVMLKKRVQQAGIPDCSPHDFRRTFITYLLKAGVDIILVQRLVGHSDPATTAKYDQRQEDKKHEAVQALKLGI